MRKKVLSILRRDVITSIRKPLPPKTGGPHKPKIAYDRKRAKRILRELSKNHVRE